MEDGRIRSMLGIRIMRSLGAARETISVVVGAFALLMAWWQHSCGVVAWHKVITRDRFFWIAEVCDCTLLCACSMNPVANLTISSLESHS